MINFDFTKLTPGTVNITINLSDDEYSDIVDKMITIDIQQIYYVGYNIVDDNIICCDDLIDLKCKLINTTDNQLILVDNVYLDINIINLMNPNFIFLIRIPNVTHLKYLNGLIDYVFINNSSQSVYKMFFSYVTSFNTFDQIVKNNPNRIIASDVKSKTMSKIFNYLDYSNNLHEQKLNKN